MSMCSFPRWLKLIILVSFGVATALYLGFAMSIQGVIFEKQSLFKFSTSVLASAVLAVTNPIFYEALVEATYPVPEGRKVFVKVYVE